MKREMRLTSQQTQLASSLALAHSDQVTRCLVDKLGTGALSYDQAAQLVNALGDIFAEVGFDESGHVNAVGQELEDIIAVIVVTSGL